ncbi:ABC transporter permease [Tsukamurella paurometabola]|uniref:ABC-2 type transport system permease protein n=1 Tax=Tsukamurella paurometabola TaxID=2061 RepID=A0ABS5NA68_TSUPA|nr:hypothetical protein [Tsukamurella paurometabola]MBS4101151.1 hypothetical protein [Tsukamurella paurometabola]
MSGELHGTTALIRVHLRTMGVQTAVTVAGIAGIVVAVMTGVLSLFETAESRTRYAATMGSSPATAAINGRGHDLDTIGGIATYEVGFFGLLVLPALVLALTIRSARGQEDLGRVDLVTAARVGRLAPLAAPMTVAFAAIAAAATGIAIGATAVGHDGAGSARYALAVALYLGTVAGFGFLCGEVVQSARGAAGFAFGVLGLLYLVRAVVDGRSLDLPWLTPASWLAAARPFSTAPPAWPYLALAGTTILAGAAALRLRSRRDLGAGVLPPRPGPATGRIRTPLALAAHLSRGAGTEWLAGVAAWGVVMGLLAQEMRSMIGGNPEIARALTGSGSGAPDDALVYLSTVVIGVAAAGVGVQMVGRLAAEESAGRFALVLSGAVSRPAWVAASGAVVAAQIVAVLVVGAVAFGTGATLAGSPWPTSTSAAGAVLVYGAAAALITSVALALFAWSPRRAALAWALPVWALLVALLAETLRMPQWLRDTSPLHWLGRLPMDSLDPVATAVILATTLTLLALGFRRLTVRDVAG